MKFYLNILFTLFGSMLLSPAKVEAQLFDRLKNAAKNKAEDRITRKVEETVDKGADSVEGATKKNRKKSKQGPISTVEKQIETQKPEAGQGTQPVSSNISGNNRFEFVPGNVVLYHEDFSQDVPDELPLKWATDNKGIVAQPTGITGKWMRMSHTSHFISPLLSQKLPEDFTAEFDIIMSYKYDGYAYPQFNFRMMQSLTGDKDGRKYLNMDQRLLSELNAVDFTLFPGEEESSKIEFQSRLKGAPFFTKEDTRLPQLDSKFGKIVHISIWVQKQRVRYWIDKDKIYDIPLGVPPGIALNRIALQLTGSIQPDNDIAVYISNFRLAAAGADNRSKLLTEGKFSTNGILFDSNSDKIKAASTSVLKDIASLLKENPNVKVRIIGHTDSDGSDTENLILSKKRAAAVKLSLSRDWGIDAARMETDGMGEINSVSDNQTEEGKSKNRRVEFIKL